jgi:hypothetical protein
MERNARAGDGCARGIFAAIAHKDLDGPKPGFVLVLIVLVLAHFILLG